MRFWTLTVILALGSAPALGHEFPEVYYGAKEVVSCSLELEAGKPITLSHTAPHYRPAQLEMVRSGKTKDFFGKNAWYRPIGSASFGSAVRFGGVTVPAGEYQMFVKVPNEETHLLIIEFKGKPERYDVHLPLVEELEGKVYDHLFMGLFPTGKVGPRSFDLAICFGHLRSRVPAEVMPAS